MAENNSEEIKILTVRGSIYSIFASMITLSLGFIRMIILLKLLFPDDFGVFTQALFFVALTARLRLPGLDRAFVQRKEVNEQDTRTYFTLKMTLLFSSVLIMVGLTNVVIKPAYSTMPMLGSVLTAILFIDVLKGLNGIQEAILTRNLSFRAIAGADIFSAFTSTIVAPYLAWQGFGVWSLVGEQLGGQIARSVALWGLFSRPWWPRVGWNKDAGKWYWNFSIKLWGDALLSFLIDRFDDYWIGRNLGQKYLGYYSRAYEFANYPRRITANPILSVFYATYSRLQSDRLKLSRAFFRATSLMVRASFWFALVFVLCAPELLTLLGEKWLPMLGTFQLMIVYTLLDPLSLGASNLLIAVGYPKYSLRTRIIQVVFFLPAVIILGSRYGIEGVALAADLMILIGFIILFWLTHHFVDYSNRRLWLWPIVGLLLTTGVIFYITSLSSWQNLHTWGKLIIKSFMITTIYSSILLLFERDQIKSGWQIIWTIINPMLRDLRKRIS